MGVNVLMELWHEAKGDPKESFSLNTTGNLKLQGCRWIPKEASFSEYKNFQPRGLRDVSIAKSIYCFCRGLVFISGH